VLLLIPLDVLIMYKIYQHYQEVRAQLTLEGFTPPEPIKRHKVVVPVGGIHRGVLSALRYARSLSDDVVAVFVDIDPARTRETQEKWARWGMGVPLRVLPSPYRSMIRPLLAYLDALEWEVGFNQQLTIVLPEFVPVKWWHFLLHGQNALLLKLALYFRRRRGYRVPVVTDVPYYLTPPEPAPAFEPPRVAAPMAVPLVVLEVLLLTVGTAFVLALTNGWPPVVEEVLGIAGVMLLAVISFILLVRSMFSLR